jgi:chemotaxis response regulator CheB
VRFVLCDDEVFLRDMVEGLLTDLGHAVTGVADTTVGGVGLIEAGRPDVVIVDTALGVNTDFDIIESAIAVGARTIVFAHTTDADHLERYSVAPIVVAKPDFAALEQAIGRLAVAGAATGVVEHDRRQRPSRAAAGPVPTGVQDAQAFYEAVHAAEAGDAMVSIDVPVGGEEAARDLAALLRSTDRLLYVFPAAVRCFLPGGGDEGIRAVLARVVGASVLPPGCRATSIVVGDGELGVDAFDRLKRNGDEQPLRPS